MRNIYFRALSTILTHGALNHSVLSRAPANWFKVDRTLCQFGLISPALDCPIVEGSASKPTWMLSSGDPGEKEGLGLSADDFSQ